MKLFFCRLLGHRWRVSEGADAAAHYDAGSGEIVFRCRRCGQYKIRNAGDLTRGSNLTRALRDVLDGLFKGL